MHDPYASMRHEPYHLEAYQQVPHPPIDGRPCTCGGLACQLPVGPFEFEIRHAS